MLKIRILAGAVLCMTAGNPMQAGETETGWRIAQGAPPAHQQQKAPVVAAGGELQKLFDEQKALQKSLDEEKKKIEEIDGAIKKGIKEEQKINELFEKIEKLMPELMAMVGSDSPLMKRLVAVAALGKKNAEAAAMAQKLINNANAERALGQATLRSLADGRRLAVAQIKSNPAQAGATTAKHLDMVRDTTKHMEIYTKWDKPH